MGHRRKDHNSQMVLGIIIFANRTAGRSRIICEDSDLQMERVRTLHGVDVTIPLQDRQAAQPKQ